ncbi:MAG: DUF2254 domain-containing protein [Alphaproteobacteria bacterium]
MIKRIQLLFQAALHSFWFIPAALVLGAVALFMGTAAIDDAVDMRPLGRYGLPFAIDAQGARPLMATLAGSLITVASLVFSMTLVALTVAAGNIGARLLVRYMRNRTIQITLGLFLAGFVFALLALSLVGDGRPVPRLTVVMSMVIAITSFLWLAFAFHDLARTIQVDRALDRLSAALRRGIDGLRETDAERGCLYVPVEETVCITAGSSGYVKSVDRRRLLKQAQSNGLRIRVRVKPGVLVLKGEPLMDVYRNKPPEELKEGVRQALRNAVILAGFRSDIDDPFFCLRLINEIALRALSPGVNDLYTAMACIDNMAEGIARLLERGVPGNLLFDSEGEAAVQLAPYDLEDFLDGAFEELRRAAAPHPSIVARLADRLGRLSRLSDDPEVREAIMERLGRIAAQVKEENYSGSDRKLVNRTLEAARAGVRGGESPVQQEN